MPSERRALGVDIGGSGIKGGLVDLDAERVRDPRGCARRVRGVEGDDVR